MIKKIIAFIMLTTICLVVVGPFKLIFDGVISISSGSALGFIPIIIGFIILRLIKPISILTGKDLKIC